MFRSADSAAGPGVATTPGIVPLRPLTLSDMFRGAFACLRANPKATLGLTAAVVVLTQAMSLGLQYTLLPAVGQPDSFEDESAKYVVLFTAGANLIGSVATMVGTLLLTGMLTVVVARTVRGSTTSVGHAWRQVRGRLIGLIALGISELVGLVLLVGVAVAIIMAVAYAVNGAAAFVVGVPVVLALVAAIAYLGTVFSLAPVVIVLERRGIAASSLRSFRLVRHRFWRAFGTLLLTVLVVTAFTSVVSVPFDFLGQMLLVVSDTASGQVLTIAMIAVGGAIAQVATTPFTAAVLVLLYTDLLARADTRADIGAAAPGLDDENLAEPAAG